jgi:uncharacterized protein YkwD
VSQVTSTPAETKRSSSLTDSSLKSRLTPADVSHVKFRALIASFMLAAVLLMASAGSASATVNSTYRWRLFLAINEVRAGHGLAPVHLASGLRNAAQAHSNDMVSRNYFAHTSPTGSTLYYRITHSTFRTYGAWLAGENLAWGTGTIGSPRNVIRMWLLSPEHRAILLSSRYTYVGVGRAVGGFQGFEDAIVWTVDFGHR